MVTPGYDLAGNMTTMPQPGNATASLTCVYDAWDRLVQVSSGGTVTAQYQYDGTGRLVAETAGSTTTYSYYSGDEVIETRVGGTAAANVQYQYVWSLRGDKVPILRDTYSGGAIQSASRIYYTTDANENVTSLIGQVSGTWVVVERNVYDAYGTVSVYNNSTWSGTPGGYASSTVSNNLCYAALSVDPATGLQHADFRWYNSATTTWTTQDPVAADRNLYRYCGNNSIIYVDPTGMDRLGAGYGTLPLPFSSPAGVTSCPSWISVGVTVIVGNWKGNPFDNDSKVRALFDKVNDIFAQCHIRFVVTTINHNTVADNTTMFGEGGRETAPFAPGSEECTTTEMWMAQYENGVAGHIVVFPKQIIGQGPGVTLGSVSVVDPGARASAHSAQFWQYR
jgi:RHS repeat-associated protein